MSVACCFQLIQSHFLDAQVVSLSSKLLVLIPNIIIALEFLSHRDSGRCVYSRFEILLLKAVIFSLVESFHVSCCWMNILY